MYEVLNCYGGLDFETPNIDRSRNRACVSAALHQPGLHTVAGEPEHRPGVSRHWARQRAAGSLGHGQGGGLPEISDLRPADPLRNDYMDKLVGRLLDEVEALGHPRQHLCLLHGGQRHVGARLPEPQSRAARRGAAARHTTAGKVNERQEPAQRRRQPRPAAGLGTAVRARRSRLRRSRRCRGYFPYLLRTHRHGVARVGRHRRPQSHRPGAWQTRHPPSVGSPRTPRNSGARTCSTAGSGSSAMAAR